VALDAACGEASLDLTLITWMLCMTPEERLRVLEEAVWSIQEMRSGGKEGLQSWKEGNPRRHPLARGHHALSV
jgi:hypothetical protein